MSSDQDRPGRPAAGSDAQTAELLKELLRRTHLSAPSDIGATISSQAGSLGATEVAVYLINYEQDTLMPLKTGPADATEPLSVAGTVAGRAYSSSRILRATADAPGQDRVWIPMLDGTERLGAIGMTFDDGALSDALTEACERYAHLAAMLIVTKSAYGDAFEVTRRRQKMTIASELVWGLAPPLIFATDDLILAGMLEPAYDNGGDTLDYAVNDRVLHLGVFDAMGHGLAAAGVAAFAVSAYRHSRRGGLGLLETYATMDDAVGQQFPDSRFVTALIAELDLDSGRLTWISAGHPPPLLIRGGRHARTLEAPGVPPLGVPLEPVTPPVAEANLEPGDLLLFYTDGLTDARGPDGTIIGLDGISRFIEREAAAGQIAPETLRRLRHTLLIREQTELRDDATALLIEWKRGGERAFQPQTVLDR